MENVKLKETHRLIGHHDKVYGLAWNPTSGHHPLCMASVGADRTVQFWELKSPSPSSLINYHNKARFEVTDNATVRSCSWSPCGKLLAAASIDRSTSIYKNQQDQHVPLLSFYLAHREEEKEVSSVSWSACGSMLATCGGANNCISIWKIKPVDIASAPWIRDVDGDDDDDDDDDDNSFMKYRAVPVTKEGKLPFPEEEEDVLHREATPVQIGADELIPLCVWRVKPDKDFTVMAYLRGHADDVNAVQWHPTTDILFSCSSDHTIKVWAPQDGHSDWQCVQTLEEADDGHNCAVLALSFNASGERMVTSSADGTLKIWGAENIGMQSGDRSMHWRHLSTITGYHDGIIFSVNWSREGIIASGGADGIGLFVEDNQSEEDGYLYKFLLKEKAHDAHINSVQWSLGEDRLLASASDDGSIKVWKLEETNEDPMELNDPEVKEEDNAGNPEADAGQGSRPKRQRAQPKRWVDYIPSG